MLNHICFFLLLVTVGSCWRILSVFFVLSVKQKWGNIFWIGREKCGGILFIDILIVHSEISMQLKRDSRATGSWNIQEEIRRVRSKATEELLRSLPSTRIDWSASTLGNRSTSGYLVDGKQEVEMGDKIHNSKNSTGANVNLSSGVTTSYGSNGMFSLLGWTKSVSLVQYSIVINLWIYCIYLYFIRAVISLPK